MGTCRVGTPSLPFPSLAGEQMSPRCAVRERRHGEGRRGTTGWETALPGAEPRGERAGALTWRAGSALRPPGRPGASGGAELDAAPPSRGRRSLPRCRTEPCATEMAQQRVLQVCKHGSVLSSIVAPLDLKCRILGRVLWQMIN